MIRRYRNFLIEIGGHLVAVFLPLFLNPYAHQSIELDKFQFFLWVTLGILLVALAAFVLEVGEKKNRSKVWKFTLSRVKLLRENNPLFLPVLIYAAVYILAAANSIDPASSWWGLNSAQGTATVMCGILFFIILVSAIQEKKQIDRLVTSLILGSIPVVVYGWIQFLGYDPLDWVSGSISHVHATLGYSLFLGRLPGADHSFQHWAPDRRMAWFALFNLGLCNYPVPSIILPAIHPGAWCLGGYYAWNLIVYNAACVPLAKKKFGAGFGLCVVCEWIIVHRT